MQNRFIDTETAIKKIHNGEMLIVVDNEDRENEGDFLMAAEKVRAEHINFMSKHGRGLICQAITEKRADQLGLAPMVNKNNAMHETAFTVSVDAKGVTTTGISAFDRAATTAVLIDPSSTADDLLRPGHVFPLIANSQGVLGRKGHTEAATDLANLAGLYPSGIICEIMDEDGSMARVSKLEQLAEELDLYIYRISDLVEYLDSKRQISRGESTALPTEFGNFEMILYKNTESSANPHFALVSGELDENEPPLVRVHSECLTGELLQSKKCDCGSQLRESMRLVQKNGGIIIYLRQEGRGIGLSNKIRAYSLQERGMDTVDANIELGFHADERNYEMAANILKDLGVSSIELLTNNPLKVQGLEENGISIVERIPLEIAPEEENRAYMETKKIRCGHILEMV